MSSRVDRIIGIGVHKNFTECYFLCSHFLSCFVYVPFHCKPGFSSDKGWLVNLHAAYKKTDSRAAYKILLTCITQSLTQVLLTILQHTKYGSPVVHKMWFACNTQSLTCVQHIACVTHEFN